jgi:16S rRNA (cytosine967-C5)-methyltransferase
VALEVLRRVTEHGAYSNLALRAALDRHRLVSREADLAAELSYGTLRRLLSLDAALAPLLRKPLEAAPPSARAALRLGAYQLLHTRIPDHAAVTETVGLVGRGERGFVNAVLRHLAADPPAPSQGSTVEAVSRRTGLVPWAVRELRRLLGDEAEEAAAALARAAPPSLRVNPCQGDPRELEARLRAAGVPFERGRLHPGSLRLGRPTAPARLPGFAEGWFTVQDQASAWVVDVLDPRPGEVVADVCAGPGGKAADIACRAGSVVAADRSERRTALVRETVKRLGVGARLLIQDAGRPALAEGSMDRVLVDAPCSGLGSARRRPELLWRPRREDLAALSRLQLRIAAAAAALLRPGGVLVYSVCTFPAAETDRVCDQLAERLPGLRPDPFRGPDGAPVERARLWPHRHGTDGMFVARFVRR